MTDYHQRFRKRFADCSYKPGPCFTFCDEKNTESVLAFIDEVVAENDRSWREDPMTKEHHERIKEEGRAEERAALIEKVERITEKYRERFRAFHSEGAYELANVYSARVQSMEYLLTHLRVGIPIQEINKILGQSPPQEETTRITCVCGPKRKEVSHQEETECCDKCNRMEIGAGQQFNWCTKKDCECHKPRTEAPKEHKHFGYPYCWCGETMPAPVTSEEKEWKAECPKRNTFHVGCGICDPHCFSVREKKDK